jgi:dephospho-CoA kinase
MHSIGLTGGIASGKSQVGRFLAEMGARVLDADRVAHEAYAPSTAGFDALVREFGRGIVGEDGVIDRGELGRRVFADNEALARLTTIVWPLTQALVEARARQADADGVGVFVVEAALLYEAGWFDMFDEVWLVRSSPKTVLHRLRARGVTDAEAQRRIDAATDVEAASKVAMRVIQNDGTLEELYASVVDAFTQIANG